MKILVTGGSGYIGSHILVNLINAGFTPIVIDNFSNSSQAPLSRVKKITGVSVEYFKSDIRNREALESIFKEHKIEAVIHLAGLKAVGESVLNPLKYYENNVCGSRLLLEIMNKFNIKKLVFSSSATVYGSPEELPINENTPMNKPVNPYGMSKLIVENILNDLYVSDNKWKIVILRYFNPVGAHISGLIGESPNNEPTNLMPLISQSALNANKELLVFGNDYNTIDGTGVRDYIHVSDLAIGHILALKKIESLSGLTTINLGTGTGYSVLEMVRAFEKASGKKIPYKVVNRRQGDLGACYADCSYAKEVLGWEAELGLSEMCEDTWRWLEMNPKGYD